MKCFAVLGALLLFAASSPALAGMVKYRTADGKEGYASEGLVPAGAIIESNDYEPEGALSSGSGVSRLAEPAPLELAPTAKKTLDERKAELARQRWTKKGREARKALEKAEREHKRWLISCRGTEELRSLYEVPPGCSDYEKEQLEAALARLKEAEEWVDDGLYDACRRDEHCLPGYIR